MPLNGEKNKNYAVCAFKTGLILFDSIFKDAFYLSGQLKWSKHAIGV